MTLWSSIILREAALFYTALSLEPLLSSALCQFCDDIIRLISPEKITTVSPCFTFGHVRSSTGCNDASTLYPLRPKLD
jgi:hypothetical protein